MLYILGFEHQVMFQRWDYSWYVNTDAKVIEFYECRSILDFSNKYGIYDGLEAIYKHVELYGYSEFYNQNIDRQYHIVAVPFDYLKNEDYKNVHNCYKYLHNHVVLQKRDEIIDILLD